MLAIINTDVCHVHEESNHAHWHKMNMKNCLGHLILVFYWFPYGLFNVHEQSVGLIVQTFLFSYTTAFFGAVLVFLILFIPRYTTYSSMLYLCGLCGGVWLCPKHCGMVCFNICTYIISCSYWACQCLNSCDDYFCWQVFTSSCRHTNHMTMTINGQI